MHNTHTSNFKVHEAKTYRSERQIHIIDNVNILHIVVDTSRQKNQKEYKGLEQYYRPTRSY